MGAEPVPSFGSTRRQPERPKDEFPPVTVPPIVLPPMQLQVLPMVDDAQLAALRELFRQAAYAGARQGLREALAEMGIVVEADGSGQVDEGAAVAVAEPAI